MLGKVILWITGLAFAGYGIACGLSPDFVAETVGYAYNNADARIEAAAMYGGLQFGFGAFCIVAALQPRFYVAGLLSIALLMGGLVLVRSLTLIGHADAAGTYSYIAVVYEWITVVLCVIALARQRVGARV